MAISLGHGTSPLVRQRLDAFLKEWGDHGQLSPEHIRFVTYTTRYNRDYWVSVEALDQRDPTWCWPACSPRPGSCRSK